VPDQAVRVDHTRLHLVDVDHQQLILSQIFVKISYHYMQSRMFANSIHSGSFFGVSWVNIHV
jgi:hypothetical protein